MKQLSTHSTHLVFWDVFKSFLLFILFLINLFKWRIITLQYCNGFANYQHELATGKHVSFHPEPPSHLPPDPIHLGCLRAPALGALLYALNFHWSSILHMAIYMFQYYSLTLSHPHFLPLSPKVCSLHLHLPCFPTCRIVISSF